MKPTKIKSLLMRQIDKVASSPQDYCFNPKTDFSRKRKFLMADVIKAIIGMESKSLTNEIIDMFGATAEAPTASAFVQQRSKIKPEAFRAVFNEFTREISASQKEDLPILAVDGSKIQIATNPDDIDSFFPGTNGQLPYNLLHLNGLFNLKYHIYEDALIQKARYANEHKALIEMVDRSEIPKAVIIADRGYESYNNLAHIQEKGWFFLFRIKDGKQGIKHGFTLPNCDSFDKSFCLKLTRKQTNKTKELFKDKNNYRFVPATMEFDYLPLKNRKKDETLFYSLSFRLVRFQISEDLYETIITNLPEDDYPPQEIKKLYASRWGIETSFRDLKYTVGLLDFHSKKVMCIQQEIYARLIMYNFAEMITSHVVIEKKPRKYTYKANFSVATHMCRLFYRGKTTSPNLEAVIARNIIPIRLDRHRTRRSTSKIFHGFLYRVA